MKAKHRLSRGRPGLEDPRAEAEEHDLRAVGITEGELPHLLLLFCEADLILAIHRRIKAVRPRE